MPIYEYRCAKCAKEFERLQKISDDPVTVCPDCQGAVQRIVSQTTFALKGSGWYKDGYASSSKSEKGNETKAEAPKETKAADKKSTSTP